MDKTIKPEEALATINVYEYTHLDDTDVKATIVSITAKSQKKKILSKLNKFVVGQIYSGKRQALHNVNQIVEKMKSGDFDDHIILGKFTDIIANEHLEEPTGGKY